MNNKDLYTYIDLYFDGVLSDAERDEFEKKCLSDQVFLQKVQAREAERDEVAQFLLENKREIFQGYEVKNIADESPIIEAATAKNTFSSKSVSETQKKISEKNLLINFFKGWSQAKSFWKYAPIPVGVMAILLIIFYFQKKDLPLTEHYKHLPYYDKLIEQGFQKRGLEAIHLQSPKQNEVIKNTLHLQWQSQNKGPFKIYLYNNKDVKIASVELKEQVFSYDYDTKNLSSGLYYWKLFLKNKKNSQYTLVYIGKFILDKE